MNKVRRFTSSVSSGKTTIVVRDNRFNRIEQTGQKQTGQAYMDVSYISKMVLQSSRERMNFSITGARKSRLCIRKIK